MWRWRRTHLGGEADRAAFRALHNASLAGPALREGLTVTSAERSVRHLRALLGTPAAGLADTSGLLAWDGLGSHHRRQLPPTVKEVAEAGRTLIVDERILLCDDGGCEVRQAIVSPLVVEDTLVGALVVGTPHATGALIRAAEEVANWVSGQLELAQLDASRNQLMEAEVRALRAQISPHFIYNSLNAIASFITTDPAKARDLVLEFADFTRYSFRRHGDFTTVAEELRCIEHYLKLERARFGDRLLVTLTIAPEVLSTVIPFLSLQPLVENAVRHGLEDKEGIGHIAITAQAAGAFVEVTIEDDGVGIEPEHLRAVLAGHSDSDHVGLRNVDARLRQVYGDDHGLVVDTAPGAGTLITMRVPKSQPRPDLGSLTDRLSA